MHVLKGRVIKEGVIVLDDPTAVEVGQVVELTIQQLADQDEDLVELPQHELQELLRRVDEARQGKTISREQLWARIDAAKG